MRVRKGDKSQQAAAYTHDETRLNIPEAGVIDVIPKAEPKDQTTPYCWDPRESPQLVWAGKAGLKNVEVQEQTSLEIPLVNLHIHERVSTEAILRSVKRQDTQRSLFADPELEGGKDLQFYQHSVDWANRMILGDSLLVMNSLVEREGMRGKVQCIYMDPPYGIQYKSNFQPRIDELEVKDGKDDDLTREVMQVQAFRDTWELGVHSYLTYLRDRLIVAKELLADSGSIFVQIGDENVHRVRCLMDEVFGEENCIAEIKVQKTGGQEGDFLVSTVDFVIWYGKDRAQAKAKYRQLYLRRQLRSVGGSGFTNAMLADGTVRSLSEEETQDLRLLPEGARVCRLYPLTSDGHRATTTCDFEFEGRRFHPGAKNHWKLTVEDLNRVAKSGRIVASGKQVSQRAFFDDYPVIPLSDAWDDVGGASKPVYAVQTNHKVVTRCILMTTDPGDLVLDPTCGSGTTAYVAEQWGRRWITCDTSRVALAIARHRLMTASFDWYRFRHETSGVAGGFKYKTVPHITLKSIAQNQEIDRIAEDFQPQIDSALAALNQARKQWDRKHVDWQEWDVPRDVEKFIDEIEAEFWAYIKAEEAKGIVFELSGSPGMLLREPLLSFWELKREMQRRIDASIQKNAPQEELVDQPEKQSGIVRVSGPFTMEAVPNVGAEMTVTVESYIHGPSDAPPRLAGGERGLGGEGQTAEPNDWPEGLPSVKVTLFEPDQTALTAVEARNVSAYISDMIQKLAKVGVETRSRQRLTFASLRPLDHAILHAEGEIAPSPPRPAGGERGLGGEGQTNEIPSQSEPTRANPNPPEPIRANPNQPEPSPTRVAVLFGPPNGSISESHVRDALRSARKYDVLLLCGYDFTAAAQEMAQTNSADDFQVLLAYVAPDTVMGDLLKDTKASQLFTMVGEPDVVVYRHGDPDLPKLLGRAQAGLSPLQGETLDGEADRGEGVDTPSKSATPPRLAGGERGLGGEGQTSRTNPNSAQDIHARAATLQEGEIFIELRGVDIYDPVTGKVSSDAGANVHAIFIDHDYDGKSFCICQALFPNKKDSWEKIAKNLKGSIDEDAFAAFRTLVSLPFKPGTSYDKEKGEGRVQIKVIDTRGNAVVKTVRV